MFVGNDAFHVILKIDQVSDELIRELQKIEPAIDPSILQTKKTIVQYWVISTSKLENFKKNQLLLKYQSYMLALF